MKQLSIFLIICFLGIISSCKKDSHSNYIKNNDPYIDSGLSFLKTVLTVEDYEKLNTRESKILSYSKSNIGIIVYEKNSIDHFIILQTSSGTYKSNRVDLSDLKEVTSKKRVD